jgi:hypothetical protein
VFLRALGTLLMVTVYFGHFIQGQVRMPLVNPPSSCRTALVIKTEDKGSDVSHATSSSSTNPLGTSSWPSSSRMTAI